MNKLKLFFILSGVMITSSGAAYGMCANNSKFLVVNASNAHKIISDFVNGKKFRSVYNHSATCEIRIDDQELDSTGTFGVTVCENINGSCVNSISVPIAASMSGTCDCDTEKPYTLSLIEERGRWGRAISVDLGEDPEGSKRPSIEVLDQSVKARDRQFIIKCVPAK